MCSAARDESLAIKRAASLLGTSTFAVCVRIGGDRGELGREHVAFSVTTPDALLLGRVGASLASRASEVETLPIHLT